MKGIPIPPPPLLRSPTLFSEDPDFLFLENNNRSEGRFDLLVNILTPPLALVGEGQGESSSLGQSTPPRDVGEKLGSESKGIEILFA